MWANIEDGQFSHSLPTEWTHGGKCIELCTFAQEAERRNTTRGARQNNEGKHMWANIEGGQFSHSLTTAWAHGGKCAKLCILTQEVQRRNTHERVCQKSQSKTFLGEYQRWAIISLAVGNVGTWTEMHKIVHFDSSSAKKKQNPRECSRTMTSSMCGRNSKVGNFHTRCPPSGHMEAKA